MRRLRTPTEPAIDLLPDRRRAVADRNPLSCEMDHFVHQMYNIVEIRERLVGLQNEEIERVRAAVRAQACDQFSLSPRRRDQGPWNPVLTHKRHPLCLGCSWLPGSVSGRPGTLDMLELTTTTNKNFIKPEQKLGSEGGLGQSNMGGVHNPALLPLTQPDYG